MLKKIITKSHYHSQQVCPTKNIMCPHTFQCTVWMHTLLLQTPITLAEITEADHLNVNLSRGNIKDMCGLSA